MEDTKQKKTKTKKIFWQSRRATCRGKFASEHEKIGAGFQRV